jgi:hypothetical protein
MMSSSILAAIGRYNRRCNPLTISMDDPSTGAMRERRDSFCLSCEGTRATLIGLKFESGLQTVTYQCPACGRIWERVGQERKAATWRGGDVSRDDEVET